MKFDLEDRFINFSVQVIGITKILRKSVISTHLYKQIIRSATAIPLNYAESKSAESMNDFIHKLFLSLKELRETKVNLELLKRSEQCVDIQIVDQILKENEELIFILSKSIKTTKEKYMNKST